MLALFSKLVDRLRPSGVRASGYERVNKFVCVCGFESDARNSRSFWEHIAFCKTFQSAEVKRELWGPNQDKPVSANAEKLQTVTESSEERQKQHELSDAEAHNMADSLTDAIRKIHEERKQS